MTLILVDLTEKRYDLNRRFTNTYVPQLALVEFFFVFFLHLSRIFGDKSKMAKIPKENNRTIWTKKKDSNRGIRTSEK